MTESGRRIVLACWGTYGDLFPTIGLALALKARGHAPTIATCAYYRPLIEAEGLAFHAVPPDIDPSDTALARRLMHARRGPEFLFREVLVPAVRDAYAALDAAAEGADLLISHPATPAAPLVARKRRMPWISTVLAPMSFFSAYDPPTLPTLVFPESLTWLGPKACGWVLALARRRTRSWIEPLLRLRGELGLPDAGHPVFEGQFSPIATLALFPGVLAEPQPDWPPGVTRAGFVSYNGPDTMPPELSRFLESGAPPVVFTLGTSAAIVPGSFFRESALAAAALGVRAVLLTGRNGANRPTAPLPEGVIAVDYAPHAELFPRAAAIVHQAGMGTTSQALRAGKPSLLVPHAHDQPDNARRVIRLGVGRVISIRRYASRRVAGHLYALLNEAQYGLRAEAIGRVVRQEDGAGAACDAIEAVLAGAGR